MKTEKDPKKQKAIRNSYLLIVIACAALIIEIVHSSESGEPLNSFFVGCGLLALAGGIYNLVTARN